MEALVVRASRYAVIACLLFVSMGASHRTENFIVTAKSKALAREIAEAAERYRADLAVQWLGQKLPRWREPCPIQADVNARRGAGGATSFLFETVAHQYGRPVVPGGDGLFQARPAGRPFGWEMSIQGSRERVLDSVLPHEVTHTIFATYFGRPLPRWADEGACTTVEHHSEKNKQHRMLHEFLTTGRGIAFNRMFAMTEYPADILPLYSQGFSLARFLIAQGGQQKFVKYVGKGLDTNDWTIATREFYGFESISDLQLTWIDWVRQGSPDVKPQVAVASKNTSVPGASAERDTTPRKTPPRNVAPRNVVPNMDRNSPEAVGWYARRREAARSGTLEPVASAHARTVAGPAETVPARRTSNELVAVPRPKNARVSSRPEPSERQREVLIEWGEPSPFLAPTLARNPKSTTLR